MSRIKRFLVGATALAICTFGLSACQNPKNLAIEETSPGILKVTWEAGDIDSDGAPTHFWVTYGASDVPGCRADYDASQTTYSCLFSPDLPPGDVEVHVRAWWNANTTPGEPAIITGTITAHGGPCVLDSQSSPSCPGFVPTTADSSVVYYSRYDFGGKTHYYAYFGGRLNFNNAWDWASRNSFKGVTGHLPTITSEAENAAIARVVSAVGDGSAWLGLTDTTYSEEGTPPRTWKWNTGAEAGTLLTSCTTWLDTNDGCTNEPGVYTNWNGSEPNNSSYESVAEMLDNGRWNDISDGNERITIVEFTMDSIQADEDVTNTAFVTGSGATVSDAPSEVAAIAGDGEAKVSWSAPASDGGSAITAYKVTASSGETCETAVGVSEDFYSCTVTGLENYTDVTFTVVATNGVGDSSASNASASIIPHTSDFQIWIRKPLLTYGQSTDIYVFGAQDYPTVTVRVGLVIQTLTPDANGTIALSFTADRENSWHRTGYMSVKATATEIDADGVAQRYYATGMMNIPRTITRDRVRALGPVKVVSRAVPEGTTVSYRIDGAEVCTADADDKGRTSCVFEGPETEGDYTLETWIGDTLYASNTFSAFGRGNSVRG